MEEQVAPQAPQARPARMAAAARDARRVRLARQALPSEERSDRRAPQALVAHQAQEVPAVRAAHDAPLAHVALHERDEVLTRADGCPPVDVGWVVAVVNLKGGSGKTTTAMHLAAAWHRRGERVVVIDADPQGSAVAWASDCAGAGEPLPWPVLGRASPTLHKEMTTLARGWDVVVLDCPPAAADHKVVRSAIRAASCVLVPCRPTAPDVRRVAPTRELVIDLAGEHDLDVVLAVLLTQTRAGTLARTAYRDALVESGVAVLDVEVPLRELFAWAEGSPTVAEAVDHYDVVAAELDTLRRP
jgi:chromosome partitioning protein